MIKPAGYRHETPGTNPPYAHAAYASTSKRAPSHQPVRIAHTLSEITGPRPGREFIRPGDEDMTHWNGGAAMGERIIVSGRVIDEDGRAIPDTLIEIWQPNAAGRYRHERDQHDAPLDPHFGGTGRVLTDHDGNYRFMTVKPGAYPWRNHPNACILDGDGAPVDDAMVEIWQANAEGRYDHPEDTQEKLLDPNFHGFGRAATGQDGRFRFQTIKPGPVPGNGGTLQAPHINVTIFSRGLLKHVFTRIYFPDVPLNANDPVLNAVPRDRRSTLIARAEDGAQKRLYRFDIVLQGNSETVFFDI